MTLCASLSSLYSRLDRAASEWTYADGDYQDELDARITRLEAAINEHESECRCNYDD